MAGQIAAGIVCVACLLLPGSLAAEPPDDASPSPAQQRLEELEERLRELEAAEAARSSEPDEAEAAARHEASAQRLEQLEERLRELEAAREADAAAPPSGAAASPSEDEDARLAQLEQRIRELEAERDASEAATRTIISQTLSDLGTNINKYVAFGGTLEVVAGWAEDFERKEENLLRLNTLELDFEVTPNDWILGSLIVEYDDGKDRVFETTEGDEASIDRINVDTAFIRLGNPQRFWPFATLGRIVVPLGISTGDPVADVLTLEDPLTVEIFETKEDAILVGFEFPTPVLGPTMPIPTPPKVEGIVVTPLVRGLARRLGFTPLPTPPPRQTYIDPPPELPPFNAAFYVYNGDTFGTLGSRDWNPSKHWGATVGYRTRGACFVLVCVPWSFEVDADFNNSIFDSLFLESEYRPFLHQIGFESGGGGSGRVTLGPLALVVEWNGALDNVTFFDDQGRRTRMRPRAWQASLAFQFGWNRWVDVIGAQGSYLTVGYSESDDLEGVIRIVNGEASRVGSVPHRRFLVGVGEWITPNLRIALEYSRVDDYPKRSGGTGRSADGAVALLTLEW